MQKLLTAMSISAILGGCMQMDHRAVTDHAFVHQASAGNTFEVMSSEIAARKAHDTDVRHFAKKMVREHRAAENKFWGAVVDAGIQTAGMPDTLGKKHRVLLDLLKKASGEDFDRQYLSAQKDAHQEAVSLYRSYAQQGANPVLRAFAVDSLPMLEKHEHLVHALPD